MSYKEQVLDDDYAVMEDFLYVIDGDVVKSPITGTVKDLKDLFEVEVVTSCDIDGRNLWGIAVPYK